MFWIISLVNCTFKIGMTRFYDPYLAWWSHLSLHSETFFGWWCCHDLHYVIKHSLKLVNGKFELKKIKDCRCKAMCAAVPYNSGTVDRCIWATKLFKYSSPHTRLKQRNSWMGPLSRLCCYAPCYYATPEPEAPSIFLEHKLKDIILNMHINWQEFIK